MGLFKKRTKLDFRRSLLRAILPETKTSPLPKEPYSTTVVNSIQTNDHDAVININIEIVDEKKAATVAEAEGELDTKTTTVATEPVEVTADDDEPDKPDEPDPSVSTAESEILLLPAEILRDIFSYLDSRELQSLYHTHTRFRAIVLEHRSFFCRELASRNLRYFARYLKPAFFDLQRESRARFHPPSPRGNGKSDNFNNEEGVYDVEECVRRYPGQANIPAWYLKLHKLDKITQELYALMPSDENEWELEYLRIQGLPPSQYNPRVWPRPGNPSFYFTHTIISFYQYNSLVKLPRESLVDFKGRDIKPVCRCAQGYFRSTAHLGILCAVYMACLKFNAETTPTATTATTAATAPTTAPTTTPITGGSSSNGRNCEGQIENKEEDEEGEDLKDCDLSLFLPELGGGLGNYIKGTRVSVKELFKMVVVVMYPGNLLKVIKDPSRETMARLRIVLETLKEVLVRNEEERRQSGVDRMYTKGLEMMEGFAKYWETVEGTVGETVVDGGMPRDRLLRYFDDWDLL